MPDGHGLRGYRSEKFSAACAPRELVTFSWTNIERLVRVDAIVFDGVGLEAFVIESVKVQMVEQFKHPWYLIYRPVWIDGALSFIWQPRAAVEVKVRNEVNATREISVQLFGIVTVE